MSTKKKRATVGAELRLRKNHDQRRIVHVMPASGWWFQVHAEHHTRPYMTRVVAWALCSEDRDGMSEYTYVTGLVQVGADADFAMLRSCGDLSSDYNSRYIHEADLTAEDRKTLEWARTWKTYSESHDDIVLRTEGAQ